MQKGQALIFLLLGIVILVGVIGGAFYLGKQTLPKPANIQNQAATSQTTPSSVLVASPTSTTTDEATNWKTYTDAQYGFSLKYPSGWRFKKADDYPNALVDIAFTDAPESPIGPGMGGLDSGLHIEVYNYNKGLSLYDFVNKQVIEPYVVYARKWDPAFTKRNLMTDTLTIDGVSGRMVSGMAGGSDLSPELREIITPGAIGPNVFIIKDSKLFFLHWQGDTSIRDVLPFWEVLSSFKFL